MPQIPKIYLETTMFNFPFVPDKPGYIELKADTQKIFDLIRAGKGGCPSYCHDRNSWMD